MQARLLLNPGRDPAQRLSDGEALPKGLESVAVEAGDLILPSPINAHDHGYGVRTLDFGALDDALEVWIPGLRLRPHTDPYLEALVAFGRLALTGVGTTMHCHNSLNVERLVDEAGMVVQAARDIGIRLALSCPLLDNDAWAYNGGPERLRSYLSSSDWAALAPSRPIYAPIREQIAAVEAIAARHADAMVDIQFGPIGPQWCSDALLEAIAEASAASGRRIHMHLLESPRQRRWLDRRFPNGIVTHLDRIGFLSPRLAVAHGVQLRPAELELLVERGAQLVTNPSANLRLRSGVAPLATLSGTAFAIGLDGTGFDDDQDLWREMRLTYLLHGGQALRRDFSAARVFEAAIATGATVTGVKPSGDFTAVDYSALTSDALFDDVDEAEMLLCRMSARFARRLYVGGREVMRGGRLNGVDFEAARRELHAQAIADRPRLSEQRRQVSALADATRRYYGQQ